jgi:hypothetical protein
MHRLHGLPHFLQQLHRDQRGGIDLKTILIAGLGVVALFYFVFLTLPIAIFVYRFGWQSAWQFLCRWLAF